MRGETPNPGVEARPKCRARSIFVRLTQEQSLTTKVARSQGAFKLRHHHHASRTRLRLSTIGPSPITAQNGESSSTRQLTTRPSSRVRWTYAPSFTGAFGSSSTTDACPLAGSMWTLYVTEPIRRGPQCNAPVPLRILSFALSRLTCANVARYTPVQLALPGVRSRLLVS